MFDEDLGPPTGTPMSATEVSARMQQIFRRMGSAYGRLQREMVQPILKRVIYILKDKGRIELPKIDGQEIDIVSVSPLAGSKAQEEIVKYQRMVETIQGTFGPQIMPMLINPQEVTGWLIDQLELNPNLIYTEQQKEEMMQKIQSAAQSGEMPPIG